VLALVLALPLRAAYNWVMTRHFGCSTPSWCWRRCCWAPSTCAAACCRGVTSGRRCGCWRLAWLAALTALFWTWWHVLPLREYRAGWHMYAAAVVVACGLAARLVQRQRALRTIGRHGHRWILDWAAEQPVLVRLHARRVLRLLGYRGTL